MRFSNSDSEVNDTCARTWLGVTTDKTDSVSAAQTPLKVLFKMANLATFVNLI